MEFVTIAKIVKLFGLQGELKAISTSDFRELRYKRGKTLYLFNEKTDERLSVHVKTYHATGNMDFVSFVEYPDATSVTPLVGLLIQAEKDQKPLGKNTYFHADLQTCDVYDENGTLLGHVKKVEEFSAQKTLRVAREGGKDFFVPFVSPFIQSVDLAAKRIVIHVLEGLI
jgi:16S rRNA processing protein RimM